MTAIETRSLPRGSRALAAAGVMLLAASCATPPPASEPEDLKAFYETNDPLEPMNRAIFGINRGLDFWIMRPLAVTYRDLVPKFLRDMVRNFLENLRTPQVLANDILQGDMAGAGDTSLRFLANSTIGVGGLFDIMPQRKRWEDFGQTLGVWGAGEGFYLMLPVLGPSSLRDAVGLAVDSFSDPITWWARNTDREWITYTRTGVYGLDTRTQNLETLDEIQRTAIDFYATLRSAYRQRRIDEIKDGSKAGSRSLAPFKSPAPLAALQRETLAD